jgi:hypothetical protein
VLERGFDESVTAVWLPFMGRAELDWCVERCSQVPVGDNAGIGSASGALSPAGQHVRGDLGDVEGVSVAGVGVEYGVEAGQAQIKLDIVGPLGEVTDWLNRRRGTD